ncbi:hypothetical protein EZS27_007767 [termite gut metagenome]|uniref:Transposase IS116/IS110/IS902 C-terminal domain-containing protein n=1 Tax=termite gut metagenome TaxID=433724 RepID=A0A5J4SEL3_9ZZZZ
MKETALNTAKPGDVTASIDFLAEQLTYVKGKIVHIEQEMEKIIKSNLSLTTNYKLLKSITDIGMMNAVILLCVTNNFQRFSDYRKFACYCGVAPFEHTSGISIRGKTKTSPLANKQVKVYLTTSATITAMCWDPQMKAYYKRKTAEENIKHR